MLLFAASQTSAMRLCALIVLALWSGVAAQDPCACKGECRTIFGEYLCYVEGGESCSRATPSMFPWMDGEAWIPCPEATSLDDDDVVVVEDPVDPQVEAAEDAQVVPPVDTQGDPTVPPAADCPAYRSNCTPNLPPTEDPTPPACENFCECNRAEYEVRETTDCSERAKIDITVDVPFKIHTTNRNSEPGQECAAFAREYVDNYATNLANIKSVASSQASSAISSITGGVSAAGDVQVSGSKGTSKASSSVIVMEGIKWFVSERDCTPEVVNCYGCQERCRECVFGICNDCGCRVGGTISYTGKCNLKMETLQGICKPETERVCVKNCQCEWANPHRGGGRWGRGRGRGI